MNYGQSKDMELFGCDSTELDEAIRDSQQPLMGGPTMLATSYLSDAQDLIAMGANDLARKMINCAKYVISSMEKSQ